MIWGWVGHRMCEKGSALYASGVLLSSYPPFLCGFGLTRLDVREICAFYFLVQSDLRQLASRIELQYL